MKKSADTNIEKRLTRDVVTCFDILKLQLNDRMEYIFT